MAGETEILKVNKPTLLTDGLSNTGDRSLRLNAINWSLRKVVARCRDYAVSPYLVHFFRAISQAERGM